MPVQFRDYYETLGVPKTATEDEIRSAFRKLARKHHPDVAKDKRTAEEKFKEINEAYEVLGDPEKRRKYDQLGANWKRGPEFRTHPGRERSARGSPGEAEAAGDFDFQFGGTGFSDFFEQFFGSMGGQGRSGFRNVAAEFSSRGPDVEADILVTLDEALNGSIRSVSFRRNSICERCNGNGLVTGRICPVCHGRRRLSRTENY